MEPDLIHDLNKYPYPFENNSVDLLEANHVLEHLDRPFSVMKEMHRILKPGGRLIIRVPHFSRGFTHAEHSHGFDVSFPNYFNKKFARIGYFGVDFKLVSMKLHWMAFFHIMKMMGYNSLVIAILKIPNALISSLANLSPNLCSRVWCFWVGGFEEIEYVFEK